MWGGEGGPGKASVWCERATMGGEWRRGDEEDEARSREGSGWQEEAMGVLQLGIGSNSGSSAQIED